MAFTDDLQPSAETYWSAILDHPMVERLGDGRLDTDPGSQPRPWSDGRRGDDRW